MTGYLKMSAQERQLKVLLEMVRQEKLSLKAVSEQIDLSYRQIRRIYKRYNKMGDAGLVHQGRGRLSNRQHPQRALVIERYRSRYEDFGPTLAAEKLLQEGFKIDHETLRRWLLAEGLWCQKRQRLPYRQRRERRAQFGELLQMDGSIHDWFEEGSYKCLLNIVDDATGKTLSRLEEGETTEGVFRLLWDWIERYGIPLALYVDLKTVYVAPKEGHLSHVEKACEKLGIRIIKAYSPQAKGRVERNHGVYQDRFVKELRLQAIRTIPGANQLLASSFIDDLNRRFEKPAREPQSAHRSMEGMDLNQMLCWEYSRQLQNDWTFCFEGVYYQVAKMTGAGLGPRTGLCVRQHLNGSISAHYQERTLVIQALTAKPVPMPAKAMQPKFFKGPKHKAGHPWKRFNPLWLDKSQAPKEGVDDPSGRVDKPDEKPMVSHRFPHTSPTPSLI